MPAFIPVPRSASTRGVARLIGILAFLCLLTGQVSAVRADHGPHTWQAAAESIVIILPTWKGYSRPGFGAPPGVAPEGSGIIIAVTAGTKSRYVLTAAHVVSKAVEISIRDHDGAEEPAEIVVLDEARDLAVLKTEQARHGLLPHADAPDIGSHACVIGNSFGLGLSFSCGVVSATGRKGIGFNAIEDFIQTDAAVNPGASGGALVDSQGALIGMVDGIFTKEADIDAGVNFAVSGALIAERLSHWRAEGVLAGQ